MKSHLALLLCGVVIAGGCSLWKERSMRSQSPEGAEADKSNTRLVGDLAVAYNMFPAVLENVGLVVGLKGTGSDPKPSPQRTALISEMQTRGVANHNAILASGDAALVLVRGVMRTGIQAGDDFDVEVRVPSQSDTTSLRGGILLETQLKEMAVLDDNALHTGRTYGVVKGPVLVDPSANPKVDRILATRGRVLGGGKAIKSRPLALVLKPDRQSAFNAARVQDTINKRFHVFEKGMIKTGVAKAKDDRYIELKLHTRYKDNAARFMAVVRSIAMRETEVERNERLARLQRQLLDPVSASRAALQLEAIGKDAIAILKKGIQSQDSEVRFYSAEALAYLDDTQAAEPLGQAARNVPAFRVFALTALSAMDDFAAADQLRQLLHVPSAETRYGAFRALWAMNPNEAAIRGENLGGQFSYHIIETSAPPMIHVTRSRRAEVVLFGRNQRFETPMVLEAGNRIMVTARKPDEIVVSKFSPREADQKRAVPNRVDDVIRAIVELGGTYPDVVQALQQAKSAGGLASRLEVDALPEAGRLYERGLAGDAEKKDSARNPDLGSAGHAGEESGQGPARANSPIPDLYTRSGGIPKDRDPEALEKAAKSQEKDPNSQEKPGPVKAFFAKIRGRSTS
jgi:flagellar basal body P-ring protein FlgI